MDLTGTAAEIHMRTDANNLVTTAQTTHLPEQKETIHMIQMLRHESLSGGIDDLAHVVSQDCLADCLTKMSAKADYLIKAVDSGRRRGQTKCALQNTAFCSGNTEIRTVNFARSRPPC